jgi:hypothetical protein
MLPIDDEAAEALGKIPEEAFNPPKEEMKSAEEMGLKADPTKPPTQFPELSERGRLVIFFGHEYFRGTHRILLDKGGSLPACRLPDEHGAADFIQSHAPDLFNTPILNCGQIGSIEADNMDLYFVTGDVINPAGCLDRARTPKRYMWTPRTEIVRYKSIQSTVIALAQTRLFGWHIVDNGTDEFKLTFKMQKAPIMEPRPGNPPIISEGPEPHGTRFAVQPDPHDREEYPDPCGPSNDIKN